MKKPEIIIITGNSSGLGKELSRNFVARGLHIFGISKSPLKLDSSGIQTEKTWNQRIGDVTNQGFIEDYFTEIANDHLIRGVVHCAAINGPLGPIEVNDPKAWQATIETNLIGTFNVLQQVSKIFRNQREGNFVAISGGGATSPTPRMTAYGASKIAVVRLVESVSLDHDDPKISFNCVAPGILPTKMTSSQLAAGPSLMGDEYLEKVKSKILNSDSQFDLPINLIFSLVTSRKPAMTGRLISAVWDDWHKIIEENQLHVNPNQFTLRRVE